MLRSGLNFWFRQTAVKPDPAGKEKLAEPTDEAVQVVLHKINDRDRGKDRGLER
jgi:hypothetical protein